jgi:hypothetical protein
MCNQPGFKCKRATESFDIDWCDWFPICSGCSFLVKLNEDGEEVEE